MTTTTLTCLTIHKGVEMLRHNMLTTSRGRHSDAANKKELVKECSSIQGRNGLRAHDQREALRKLADFGRGGIPIMRYLSFIPLQGVETLAESRPIDKPICNLHRHRAAYSVSYCLEILQAGRKSTDWK